ncbi:hypothetical protein MP35_04350 [Escherichia coli N40513]|nr:conserved hypothetical protein [Escherichia coli H299]EMD10152.1 hypothetical protein A364_11713 [Escherichia coli SEPT362]EWC54354.1 hypothetical protein G654_18652 [Escherichia coli EC096/10]KDX41652.1 hypothetical protein AC69_5176 [Escherichia coli 2-177-06_S4_C1]KEJ75423.1 hypothetical protein AB67_2521 [Escherichia coli 5-366-08_S1_C3]KEL62392.1 hypothetical protein AB08_5236 [Escherichia coli 5-366-08_S1_C1]OMI59839.1 hypothetical protein MP35_04350 [Escherichia coli N40513]
MLLPGIFASTIPRSMYTLQRSENSSENVSQRLKLADVKGLG